MAFSSIPVYLDPPNWQQQINQQQGDVTENHQLLPSLPPPSSAAAGGSGSGSIRPCSMSERAKLEKIPQPEPGLKCPRCDSTNTKFCYFNNYSLSQPRHFCKTCRRYWTRGGALRNVPVGGGCRRNKRSKRSRSKSPAVALERQSAGSNSAVSSTDIMGHFPHPPPELRFLPSMHQLTNFPSGDGGLNFGEIQTSMAATGCSTDMEFQIGNNPSVAGPIMSARLTEQLRLQQVQQFPYFTGLEPSGAAIYQLENESIEPSNYVEGAMSHQPGAYKPMESVVTHLSTVKPEENVQGFNLSRSFLGIPGNDQYWGGNAWTDLSGLNSSSSGNLL